MRAVFDLITRVALRLRYLTIAGVIAVVVLGAVAGTELQQELIPPIEFPQTIILAQVSGLSSEQVLNVLTEPLEDALSQIPEIVNIESTTTGSIGAIITASNEFGLNQDELREKIQIAIDSVWLPHREIAPPNEDVPPDEFARTLMTEMTAEVLIFLAERNENFLFQLSPSAWQSLSDETLQEVLAYLANQYRVSGNKSALQELVEQSVSPELNALPLIANVVVSGGQALPGESEFSREDTGVVSEESRLLQLSSEVWSIVQERFPQVGDLDESAVDYFSDIEYEVPEVAPELPQIWQMDHFKDAEDLREMAGAVVNLAGVFNGFMETGRIIGSLGRTDDLTPEVVSQLLELDASLVNSLNADHLVAMSPEVFEVLPDQYIASLDGFTRDALAASALAQTITGQVTNTNPVLLPSSWRIQPPQIITFSFADLPLATFSVFNTGLSQDDGVIDMGDETATDLNEGEDDSVLTSPGADLANLPVGPELPQIFSIIGEQFGATLDTADDLVSIPLDADIADMLGADRLSAAEFFNLLTQLDSLVGGSAEGQTASDFDIASFVPALAECGVGVLDVASGNLDFGNIIIGCVDPTVFEYLVENDPEFVSGLSADVYAYFDAEIYEIEGVSPLLGDVWTALNDQPQFSEISISSADDIIALGRGNAAELLNLINSAIPEQFSGYEIRLFDSLSPEVMQYLTENSVDFYANLDDTVLLKLSPETLATLPDTVLGSLSESVQREIRAIIEGDTPSAATALADLYETESLPADPTAPALNSEWQFLVDFVPGVDALDNAYDFFRFEATRDVAGFINAILDGPGANLAVGLLGNMSQEAFDFIAEQDPAFLNELDPRALNLLDESVYANLPESVKERAEAGERFVPSAFVTRTNGASSLLVTVYKNSDVNTVEAWYSVLEVINEIDADNPDIEIQVAFEQSSFIETSIAGVVREGSLGALFAVINILVFLSGGIWLGRGRQFTGVVLILVSLALMGVLLAVNYDAANNNLAEAFAISDTVLRILSLVGVIAGLVIVIYPGQLPYPSWRSTLVIGVSIPLSILSALALMRWFPLSDGLTLNIMTLSGLTVAVGRVVDDSIVVLENIFRQIQTGLSKEEAILSGVRDVSVAIFSATSIAVVVFLPLGLTGGLIGEFFLPFGLAVTYALLSSFFMAITVIPVLAYLFISVDDVPEERETWMQAAYVPVLKRVLGNPVLRVGVVILAFVSAGFGAYLLSQRPAAFLPDFGEPQISISVEMPQGTSIVETNQLVVEMESAIEEIIPVEERSSIRTSIGGGGLNLDALFGGGTVSENVANITIGMSATGELDAYTEAVRARAVTIFGEESVTVSAATLASGGFGGFELVVSGPDQETLDSIDAEVVSALSSVEGLANISSTLEQLGAGDSAGTYIRVNGQPAISYTGELETEDSINVTNDAIETIRREVELPEGVSVGQGFDSELQSEGFGSLFIAMGIAIVIVIAILIVVFGSPVYWSAIILSIVVAPVGAAIALTISDRVLGISSLIGLLMLLGLVVTNAVVLIDRVGSNQVERGMSLYDALIEAGSRRLRPILMTALATIIALIPLAIGLSEGAIIAKELGTVVIGGVISSTLLTLIVTPAAYYLLTPLHEGFMKLIGRRK